MDLKIDYSDVTDKDLKIITEVDALLSQYEKNTLYREPVEDNPALRPTKLKVSLDEKFSRYMKSLSSAFTPLVERTLRAWPLISE